MRSSTRHGGAPPTSAARAPHGTSPFPATRVSQSRSAEDLSGARRSPSAARHPGAGWMRVADVLADDAGAQAGDLRPLHEIHLRSRHSSPPAASNRSSPSGAAPAATQATRWSPRSAATGAYAPLSFLRRVTGLLAWRAPTRCCRTGKISVFRCSSSSRTQTGELPHRLNMRPCGSIGPSGWDRPADRSRHPPGPAPWGWCQNKEE